VAAALALWAVVFAAPAAAHHARAGAIDLPGFSEAAGPLPPLAGVEPAPGARRRPLSDERTLSRWAYVQRRTVARRRPDSGADRVKTLQRETEDGTRELVLALAHLRQPNGRTWVKVRLPMRPNGTTGWVAREHLGGYRVVRTFLRIDRDDLTAALYRRGERVWHARVGIGVKNAPTPRGRFYVRERLVPRDTSGIYGIFAFGTSAYSPTLTDWPGGGVIGIHGTNQPQLIPGRISHGCVRVRNAKIRRLRAMMPLGTPIAIR